MDPVTAVGLLTGLIGSMFSASQSSPGNQQAVKAPKPAFQAPGTTSSASSGLSLYGDPGASRLGDGNDIRLQAIANMRKTLGV